MQSNSVFFITPNNTVITEYGEYNVEVSNKYKRNYRFEVIKDDSNLVESYEVFESYVKLVLKKYIAENESNTTTIKLKVSYVGDFSYITLICKPVVEQIIFPTTTFYVDAIGGKLTIPYTLKGSISASYLGNISNIDYLESITPFYEKTIDGKEYWISRNDIDFNEIPNREFKTFIATNELDNEIRIAYTDTLSGTYTISDPYLGELDKLGRYMGEISKPKRYARFITPKLPDDDFGILNQIKAYYNVNKEDVIILEDYRFTTTGLILEIIENEYNVEKQQVINIGGIDITIIQRAGTKDKTSVSDGITIPVFDSRGGHQNFTILVDCDNEVYTKLLTEVIYVDELETPQTVDVLSTSETDFGYTIRWKRNMTENPMDVFNNPTQRITVRVFLINENISTSEEEQKLYNYYDYKITIMAGDELYITGTRSIEVDMSGGTSLNPIEIIYSYDIFESLEYEDIPEWLTEDNFVYNGTYLKLVGVEENQDKVRFATVKIRGVRPDGYPQMLKWSEIYIVQEGQNLILNRYPLWKPYYIDDEYYRSESLDIYDENENLYFSGNIYDKINITNIIENWFILNKINPFESTITDMNAIAHFTIENNEYRYIWDYSYDEEPHYFISDIKQPIDYFDNRQYIVSTLNSYDEFVAVMVLNGTENVDLPIPFDKHINITYGANDITSFQLIINNDIVQLPVGQKPMEQKPALFSVGNVVEQSGDRFEESGNKVEESGDRFEEGVGGSDIGQEIDKPIDIPTQITKTRVYTSKCTNANYCLYYINTYGGWNWMLFEGKQMETDNNAFSTYNDREGYELPYKSETNTVYDLTSVYLTDEGSEKLRDLYKSPSVYIQDLNNGSEPRRVLIDTKSYQIKTFVNNGRKYFTQSIKVKDNFTKKKIIF